MHVADIEGNNAVRYGVDLALVAPSRGMLASLQGSPQDLMCGDQGTTHVLHVPLLRRCRTMETQGEGREETQHHEMRSTHPYSFMEVDSHKKVIGLCSGSMESFLHSYIQSSLVEDVSLHGNIFPGRPLDQKRRMYSSHVGAPLMDFRRVETLVELDTTLGVWGRLKERWSIPSTSYLPTSILDSSLLQK